jgi:hypothetical protein
MPPALRSRPVMASVVNVIATVQCTARSATENRSISRPVGAP